MNFILCKNCERKIERWSLVLHRYSDKPYMLHGMARDDKGGWTTQCFLNVDKDFVRTLKRGAYGWRWVFSNVDKLSFNEKMNKHSCPYFVEQMFSDLNHFKEAPLLKPLTVWQQISGFFIGIP